MSDSLNSTVITPTEKKGMSGKVVAAALLAASAWGFSFIAVDILLDTYAPIQVQALRWPIAAIFFAILGLTGIVKMDFRGKPKKWIILTAAVQPCLYAIFETYGVKYTSPSMSSIFIATIPCMILILGMLFFHRHTKPIGIVGILAVIELCRRSVGIPILCVASAFILYSLYVIKTVVISTLPINPRLTVIWLAFPFLRQWSQWTPMRSCLSAHIFCVVFCSIIESIAPSSHIIIESTFITVLRHINHDYCFLHFLFPTLLFLPM